MLAKNRSLLQFKVKEGGAMSFFKWLNGALALLGNRLQPLLLLLLRLLFGWLFLKTGWSKLSTIGDISSYFAILGIPWPGVMAYVVALTETIGGALLIAGVATRLASLVLSFTMVVAIVKAHGDVLAHLWIDLGPLIDLTAFTYLMATLALFVFGPGRLSLDALFGNDGYTKES
jgi:putative oxidoreductase